MGSRQSQEPAPSPLEVSRTLPPPSSQRPSYLPPDPAGDYLPLHRTHAPRAVPSERPSHPLSQRELHVHRDRDSSFSRSRQPTSADLLEFNLALSRLQQRLQQQAEREGRGHRRHHHHRNPHTHGHTYNAALNSGLPIMFVRRLATTTRCPLCSREVMSSEAEAHMIQCAAKPRVTYNTDLLTQEAGECCICLEDMVPGDQIARLPCLCVYHLKCVEQWFKVSQTCPEHPDLA